MISLMLILGLLPPGHLTTSPDEVAGRRYRVAQF
jgi:hypothetical protein